MSDKIEISNKLINEKLSELIEEILSLESSEALEDLSSYSMAIGGFYHLCDLLGLDDVEIGKKAGIKAYSNQ